MSVIRPATPPELPNSKSHHQSLYVGNRQAPVMMEMAPNRIRSSTNEAAGGAAGGGGSGEKRDIVVFSCVAPKPKPSSSMEVTILLASYLRKRSKGTQWKRRWVSLSPNSLAYFKLHTDSEPLRIIRFEGTRLARRVSPSPSSADLSLSLSLSLSLGRINEL